MSMTDRACRSFPNLHFLAISQAEAALTTCVFVLSSRALRNSGVRADQTWSGLV